MCRIWRFLAVLRSFFHSSLLGTFSCHPSPPTILPPSLTFILPSISWSTSISLFPNSYIILFWEFYFLPFSIANSVYKNLLKLRHPSLYCEMLLKQKFCLFSSVFFFLHMMCRKTQLKLYIWWQYTNSLFISYDDSILINSSFTMMIVYLFTLHSDDDSILIHSSFNMMIVYLFTLHSDDDSILIYSSFRWW